MITTYKIFQLHSDILFIFCHIAYINIPQFDVRSVHYIRIYSKETRNISYYYENKIVKYTNEHIQFKNIPRWSGRFRVGIAVGGNFWLNKSRSAKWSLQTNLLTSLSIGTFNKDEFPEADSHFWQRWKSRRCGKEKKFFKIDEQRSIAHFLPIFWNTNDYI